MKPFRIEVSYTTREYQSLNLYFNDLAKIDLLDEQEEVMLCRRLREGDVSALDRLVRETCVSWFPVRKNMSIWDCLWAI